MRSLHDGIKYEFTLLNAVLHRLIILNVTLKALLFLLLEYCVKIQNQQKTPKVSNESRSTTLLVMMVRKYVEEKAEPANPHFYAGCD